MAKYLVWPEGYDPRVAEGPPTDVEVRYGLTWTPEDTERMRAMVPEETNVKIEGRWHQDKEEYDRIRNT